MLFGSRLKYILGFVGITVTLILVAMCIVRNDKAQPKKAVITFVSAWVALVVISTLEFLDFS